VALDDGVDDLIELEPHDEDGQRADRSRLESFDARLDQIAEEGWPERPAPRGRLRKTPSPQQAERRLTSMRGRVRCR
jgi:hypothetical protein